jgi:hypothetical protein
MSEAKEWNKDLKEYNDNLTLYNEHLKKLYSPTKTEGPKECSK